MMNLKLLNGLIDVQVSTDVKVTDSVELFEDVVETMNNVPLDLGDLMEGYENIKTKISESIADQDDPVDLTNDEINFIYGLALILNIS